MQCTLAHELAHCDVCSRTVYKAGALLLGREGAQHVSLNSSPSLSTSEGHTVDCGGPGAMFSESVRCASPPAHADISHKRSVAHVDMRVHALPAPNPALHTHDTSAPRGIGTGLSFRPASAHATLTTASQGRRAPQRCCNPRRPIHCRNCHAQRTRHSTPPLAPTNTNSL